MSSSLFRANPPASQQQTLAAQPMSNKELHSAIRNMRGMLKGKFGRLSELFSPAASRSETVATFLAVLELVRAGRLKISNEEKLSVNYSRLKKQENA